MFEVEPQMASDLEWMLQSGQVSKDILLEALVEQYYRPVTHFSLAFLGDSEGARRAAVLALANALAEQYNYRDYIGVNTWVYGFALETCLALLEGRRLKGKSTRGGDERAETGQSPQPPGDPTDLALRPYLDGLETLDRAAVLLYYLVDLELIDIAKVLDYDISQISELLDKVRTIPDKAHEKAGKQPAPGGNEPDPIVRESLHRRWPEMETSQGALATQAKKIAQLAGKRSAQKLGVSRLKEIAVISILILGIAAITWGANMLWPEPEADANARSTEIITKVVLVTQWVTPTVSPTPTATPFPQEFYYHIEEGDTLESAAAHLGVDAESLRTLNRLPAGAILQPGQELLIPGMYEPSTTATRVPQARHVQPLQAPYTSLEILNRLKLGDDLFNTLWFDAVVTDYGPPAYLGPVRAHRVQVWLSQNQVLVVIGRPDNHIEEVWLMQDDRLYMANPAADQPWFVEAVPNSTDLYQGLEHLFLTIMGNNDPLVAGETLSAVDREEWAGQQVLVVDEINYAGQRQARLWMDDRTGLVLHKQWYSAVEESVLTQEISLLGIAYDRDFPQELFDPRLPWRGGFAADASGTPEGASALPWATIIHESRPYPEETAPPPGYNPADGQLTFVYPDDFSEQGDRAAIELFADGYLLGKVNMGNPWRMICQRSPDGERIAFVGQPPRFNIATSPTDWLGLQPPDPDHNLYWFDFGSLDGVNAYVPLRPIDLDVSAFAWAPDSRRLAVFGYKPGEDIGALYVVDSETLEAVQLIDLDSANSIVWRQDGRRVALIARFTPGSYEEVVLILDAVHGGITNYIPIDIQNGYSDDWPVDKWEANFPVQMGGLQACAAPNSASADK